MSLAPIENQLSDRIGLDAASLGGTTLGLVVARRMRERHVTTTAAYAGLIAIDVAEWDGLLADLLVTETWFFRGGRPLFDYLARSSRSGDRVLVVPCSTGEEAFSLSAALADAGKSVRVDAVDLVGATIARAGRYAAFSFRERDGQPRPPHFAPDGDAWTVSDELRAAVRFRTGNATDPTFLAGEGPFDLILCRNLFIYLTPAARKRVTANLARLLAPGGRLCLTPSEAEQLPPGAFAADGPPGFLIFRRGRAKEAAVQRRAVAGLSEAGRSPTPTRLPASKRPATEEPASERPATAPPPDILFLARALADAGDLDAARAACESIIRFHPTADGFALLGVVHLAANRADDAAESLRKALYLDPHHADALEHTAILADRRGDPDRAAALRHRLAKQEGKP